MSVLGTLWTLPQPFFDGVVVNSTYTLPDEHLSARCDAQDAGTSELRSDDQPQAEGTGDTAEEAEVAGEVAEAGSVGSTCIACGIGTRLPAFAAAEEQRAHFKSDWHRLNVKRRLAGRERLSEEEFSAALDSGGGEVESISGSGESDSDDDGGARHARGSPVRQHRAGGSPQEVFFTAAAGSRRLPGADGDAADCGQGCAFAVWRCLLRQDHLQPHQHHRPSGDGALVPALLQLRRSPQRWAVVLYQGGHFAAAVFQLTALKGAGKKLQHDASGWMEVLCHKTEHRYVVRAKAGGKQSSKDATGKTIKSAGSQIRRHNEAALARTVAETLAAWQPQLASCSAVFVHAPSGNSKAVFAAGGPLEATDARVRRIPFVTRRPTFSETKRIVAQLSAVYRVDPSPPADRSRAVPQDASPPAAAAPAVLPQRPAEQADRTPAGTTGLSGCGEAADALTASVADSPSPSGQDNAGSELHVASRAGNAARVSQLLEAGADPGQRDGRGRLPFQLAPDKDTRNAFRRFMAQQPDLWDYAAAGVPSALTPEMEAEQLSKQAEKRARQRERERQRKSAMAEKRAQQAVAEHKALEDDIAAALQEADLLAARQRQRASASEVSRRASASSSSSAASRPDRDAARRRELMAAAAEARMKALQEASQKQQLW